jgi:hypothetical protein
VPVRAAQHLTDVVAGMGAFGDELYRRNAAVTANWVASPFSVDVVFGMLRAGGRGTTARDLDGAFGYPRGRAPQGAPHEALNALTGALDGALTQPTGATGNTSGHLAPRPLVAIRTGIFVDHRFAAHFRHD